MKKTLFLLILAATFGTADSNAQTQKTTKTLVFTDEEETVPPPPYAVFKKTPIDLQSWLIKFANEPVANYKPVVYKISVFASGDDHVMAVGELENGKAASAGYNYFLLKKDEFKNSGLPQVVQKLQTQIKSFTRMPWFKQTEFAKAGTVVFLFDDTNVVELK